MIDKTEKTKKRGRPEVDSEAVTARFSREVVTAIDQARTAISDQFPPSRTEIVRAATIGWLKEKGFLK